MAMRHRGSAEKLVLALAAVSCCACFESTTILRVRSDGSGTLQQRTIVKQAALAQLRTFATLGGGRATLDPLSEDQARQLATSLGAGVTYVSSTPIANADGQGREANYAFTDVSQLRVSEQPQAPGGVTVRTQGLSTDSPAITLSLTHEPGGNAVLHILVPPPAIFAGADQSGGINPAVFEQLQGLKAMLAGAHLLLAMEPQGRLVRTSSPYVDGQRVTLLEVDLDRVLGDEAFLDRLRAAKTLDEVRAVTKDAPGLKINLDPEITVEFTGQPPPAAVAWRIRASQRLKAVTR
ncbi:MAG: hypothetical protein DMG01_22700 [Acidobacteria bacterium]|nr:MAG: hypothetical protein DMG01_22700 [Acidobacteriota bacterium]